MKGKGREGKKMERIHAKERGSYKASWEAEDITRGENERGVGGGEERVSRDTIEVFTYT